MQAYKIWVSGKVQGVFFRKFTQEKAQALGLDGFVQNLNDGRVYMEVEGAAAKIDELISWCDTGSPQASVKSVRYEKTNSWGHPSFYIKR